MKTKACISSIIFLGFLFFIILISTAGAANKIMPLGDSITQGVTSGVPEEEFQVSYRKTLYDKLKAAGNVVNDEIYVGTLFSGESVADFDPEHDGHSGWRADEIVAGRTGSGEGQLSDWLITEEPNIVLLHIGTNDISNTNEDWHEVEDILAVIDDYEFASGKAVWVILSLIVDRGCDPYLPPCPKSLETTTFNNDVRDFVFFPRQAGGDKILLADMQNGAGINYDRWDMGGDMWDDVHPFETGYAKMADLWYTRLMEILPQADAGPDQSVDGLVSVTLDASGSTDPKNGNLTYQWEQTAGTAVVLSDAQAVQPTFVAPELGSCGQTLKFRVTVTDEDELESADTVSIEVGSKENCPFEDVPAGFWAQDYIYAIFDNGITNGCSQNPLNYCPQKTVTREQMAAFIVRAVEGEPAANYCDTGSPFADVSPASGFCKYIKRLSELGITSGCGGGNYCPKNNVTRGQMAAFIIRAVEGEPAANYCDTGSPFADVSPASGFCKYIKRFSELGITSGCGGGNYCPNNIVTRDQMAVFLARAFLMVL